MSEKIIVLNPDPNKQGVQIDRAKYDYIKGIIIEHMKKVEDIGFSELMDILRINYQNEFDGSINWYYTTVKLDLEARGIIERVPKISPQRLRLARSSA